MVIPGSAGVKSANDPPLSPAFPAGQSQSRQSQRIADGFAAEVAVRGWLKAGIVVGQLQGRLGGLGEMEAVAGASQ
jgi:hypothetical protein